MASEKTRDNQTVLGGYRALDLTDEKGAMCGWALAALGAEVIKVEPPGGDPSRSIPPFYGGVPHPEKSLFFFAYNTNKKSITLNLETVDGRVIFEKLVRSADFVIESFKPGYMEAQGLGYSALDHINPRIVMTAITPFGQTGPYRGFKTSDLMCSAMSGFMYLTGDPDREPIRISVPQAYALGGAEGAIATMTAHYFRERTGEGQYVDVSIRESMLKTAPYSLPWMEKYGKLTKRSGPYWTLMGQNTRVHWPCKDGSVTFVLPAIKINPDLCRRFIEWMAEKGIIHESFNRIDWNHPDMASITPQIQNELESSILNLCKTLTRSELMEGLIARGITAAPVNTMEDISRNEQLRARDFWEQVEHGEMGASIPYPGAFIRATETPCVKKHRAPMIGEHNREIYVDFLGIPKKELVILKVAGII
ncbi:MAG: CoA transferase [Deltaproteobacteria bacterium]|nr:CoA transferase [Deltaproteobacteria bacterium]